MSVFKWLHIVGRRPLHGCGVLLSFGEVGWSGACINVLLNSAPLGCAMRLYVLLEFVLMRDAKLLYVLLAVALMVHATLVQWLKWLQWLLLQPTPNP